ncbi:hypothetical protein ACZ90_52595 [Streptomyces albus subsp. albus]|nr:hypothetical protein ACZ90_52595 [Streptomyces albus subsp. albus]
MTIAYDNNDHFIAANTTLGFNWSFSNGDYYGPIMLAAAPNELHQALEGSLGHPEFTARDSGGLTSRCFYHNTVTNYNGFGVMFRSQAFHD